MTEVLRLLSLLARRWWPLCTKLDELHWAFQALTVSLSPQLQKPRAILGDLVGPAVWTRCRCCSGMFRWLFWPLSTLGAHWILSRAHVGGLLAWWSKSVVPNLQAADWYWSMGCLVLSCTERTHNFHYPSSTTGNLSRIQTIIVRQQG